MFVFYFSPLNFFLFANIALARYETIRKNIEISSNQMKRIIKTQHPKDKTITRNKETQMTGQHEPLSKPEVKSGTLEG